jgi:hypothetical protein
LPTIELPNNWQPRRYQFKLWDAIQNKGVKRAIEIAHRRWGKDDVILHHTAIEAHKRVATYWHCLPEYEQARKAIWNAVNPHTGKRRIDEAFPHELRESKDEQQMFIRFKNGSTWQVIGSDRYNSLVGAGVAGVVFSEWALCNPSSWGYIRPMMEENDGWATFITTPRGRNHAKAMYDMAKGNPRWFAEVSSIYDTGALTQDQLDESLAEYIALYGEDIGRAQFEQEYLCSFNAAILGAFYAREMVAVRNEGRIKDIVANPRYPVHTAWDLGVRDDTSIWWFQVYGGKIYILDCYTANSAGIDHYADIVHSKPYKRGIDFVPHDAKVMEWGTGRTRVETMRQYKLNPQLVSMASKMDGINAVRRTLPLCIFHPRCEDVGIAALEQYRREWDDERKTFKPTEVHDWTSHLADAFRYLAMGWRNAQAVEIEQPKPQPIGTVYLLGAPEQPSKTRIKI